VSRLARFAILTLAVNVVVILWGALVRATGSGAGCGSHWPLCNGTVVPRGPTAATLIEVTHRLTSGIALVLVVALTVWCFRSFPRRHVGRRAAAAALILILIEAALGAGIVLLELVGDDASPLRALYMALHLANTFFLLAALALTCWSAAGGPAPHWSRRAGLELAVAMSGLLLVAAAGAVTALGDTLFPAASLAGGLAQDRDPAAHLLVRLRILHPLLAVAVSGHLLLHGRLARRLGSAVALLALSQLAIGAVNIGLLAPLWLQLVHLLFADALWVALVLFAIAMLSPSAATAPGAGALARSPSLAHY
jgi:heme a synthase